MSILDRFSLAGKIALVTGASSGLGAGFAVALAEAGADVVLAARRQDGLEAACRAVEKLGRSALAVPADVTDPAACRAAVQAAVDRFGRLDVLVNNAGMGTAAPIQRDQVPGQRLDPGPVAGRADDRVGAQLLPSVKWASGPSNRSMPGFMTTRPAFSARAKPSSTAIVTPSVRCRVNGPSAGRG